MVWGSVEAGVSLLKFIVLAINFCIVWNPVSGANTNRIGLDSAQPPGFVLRSGRDQELTLT